MSAYDEVWLSVGALHAVKGGFFNEGSKVTFEPKDLDLEQILFYMWLLAPLEHRFFFFSRVGGWARAMAQ